MRRQLGRDQPIRIGCRTIWTHADRIERGYDKKALASLVPVAWKMSLSSQNLRVAVPCLVPAEWQVSGSRQVIRRGKGTAVSNT